VIVPLGPSWDRIGKPDGRVIVWSHSQGDGPRLRSGVVPITATMSLTSSTCTNSEVETESGVVGGLSKVKGAWNSDYIYMYSGSTGDELAYAGDLEGSAAFIDIWNAST
jgi:hypothetical protein